MIENGLNHLDRQAQSRPLADLEAGVWAGIAVRRNQRQASRTVVAWQSAVLAVALMSSIGLGARAATNIPVSGLGVFSPHGSLSPAERLGGH